MLHCWEARIRSFRRSFIEIIALALVRIQNPRSKLSVPGRVVIMRHDFFQLEVDKVLWVQRALFLLWLGRGLVGYVVVSSSRSSCDGEQRNR